MSATGDSTRDWLLKKLLKASRNLAEQQAEITQLQKQMRAGAEYRKQLIDEGIRNEAGLLDRIRQMAPEKQFHIVSVSKTGRNLKALPVLAVSSANGTTTITVQRT